MTDEQLKAKLAESKEAIQKLEELIADNEQLKGFIALLAQGGISNIAVHTSLPTGEAIVVSVVDGSGVKHRFASKEANGEAILTVMLEAGLAHIEGAIAARKEVMGLL